MIIINNHSRSILAEGRKKGFGFAFAKKVSEYKSNTFETVMPVSPCKDYLNDIVAVENGAPPFTVYGLSSKKTDLFKNGVFLVIRICDTDLNEEKDIELKEENKIIKKMLDKEYNKIKNILNEIEEKITDQKTEIYKANDGYYLLEVPRIWVMNGPMISFYGLIIRNALFATEGIEKLLLKDNIYPDDISFIDTAVVFHLNLMNGYYPEMDYSHGKYKTSPFTLHNEGFIYYHQQNKNNRRWKTK